jgi:hypothetical protein
MINFDSKLKPSLQILLIMFVINVVAYSISLDTEIVGVSTLILFSIGLVFIAGLAIGIKIREIYWKTAFFFLIIEVVSYKNLTESVFRSIVLIIGMALGVFMVQIKNRN